MIEDQTAKSPNFIRDQFILIGILLVALYCRSSLVSSQKTEAGIAQQSASVSAEQGKLAAPR